MTPDEITAGLIAQHVLPVLRFDSARMTLRVLDCLHRAGFRAFEITLTTPDAIDLIAEARQRLGPSVLIGAGTVTDMDAARGCIAAGAQFLVSPCLLPGLARLASDSGLAAMIGAFTPTEVLAAVRDGADIVKVFPAMIGGPAHVASLHAVLPQVRLCPTGGVTLDTVEAYLSAGAAMVGIGNNLVDRQALAAGDDERVIAAARRYLTPQVPRT